MSPRPASYRRSREPWTDGEPIRSALFSDEQLARHAISLADSHITTRRATPVVSLLKRLQDNAEVLGECYLTLSEAAASGVTMSPAAEWLIDNFHILEQNTRTVRRDLPRSYFSQLPKLASGFLAGHPRIFAIMWAYVAHTDALFDPDQLARYISAYERRKALTLGELWAVAINLRILLIENARRQGELLVRATRHRQQADELADRLIGLDAEPVDFSVALLPAEQATAPSRAFCVQLMRRLSGQQIPGLDEWLDSQVARLGGDQEMMIRGDLAAMSVATVTMRNVIHSLRLVNDTNWEDWLEQVSAVEAELRRNPGYREMDFASRNSYRSAIERLARGSGQQEIDIARAAWTRARQADDEVGSDIGYWLLDDGLGEFEAGIGYRAHWRERRERIIQRLGLPGYLGALGLGTAAVVALLLWVTTRLAGGLPIGWLVALGVFGAIAASEQVLAVLNYAITKVLPTSARPALALRNGIPAEMRTLVVVPTMITSAAGIDELADTLEVHFLANDDGEVYFAAVTDWADAPSQHAPGDDELLQMTRDRIRALNQTYGDRFFLYHRERRWNPSEGVWMGWERKRGKLMELNALLRGATDTSYIVTDGLPAGRIRYVVTLDADTRMPRESAKKLVGKIAHPLNRAVTDPATGRVRRGFSILQPRVTPSLPALDETSVFQSIYSTQRGLSPYAVAISDVYQDLFGRGSFSGKGIYDIDSLETALADRIPENTVLSHDLLEGNYSRSGLVTDVELVEEYPTSYEVDTKRQHRWIRGDWQLWPWILWRRAGLDGLGIWKMLDNLRRSLVPIASVVGFLVALASGRWQVAALWAVLMVLLPLLPAIIPMVPALLAPAKQITAASKYHALGLNLAGALAVAGLNLVFLAHRAVSNLDAIGRTLWRLLVSRRQLLEWTTAAAAAAQASGSLRRFAQQMAPSIVFVVLTLVIGAIGGWQTFLIGLPIALAWLVAPLIAQRTSLHTPPAELQITDQDVTELRVVARRTWGFFDTFVTAEQNHLPPDNFQEDPEPKVANRTSPTNIGLYLLTVISARDFGWIGDLEAAERLSATMTSLRSLEHHHGHLYNWYDTTTSEPLNPKYVSAVDSGNLAGHLLALASFCRQRLAGHTTGVGMRDGLADGVGLIAQVVAQTPAERWGTCDRARVAQLVDALGQAQRGLPLGLDADALAPLAGLASELAHLPQLPGMARHAASSLGSQIASLRRDLQASEAEVATMRAQLAEVEAGARQEFDQTDFGFVYDRKRRLLAVGYNVDEQKLDDSNYDLLASEARLGSYVAIAKGDLPTRHWTRLGRAVTAVGGGAALLSWSGSMFEYLMPMLVMRQPVTGLLDTTCDLAVQRQIQYANQVGCPVWGISEAGYFARDPQLNYQYSPFGVPGLGLVRGLSNNLVIAPYATGLASMVNPTEATANYRKLTELGALGRYGYYEALDFTKRRLPDGRRYEIVRSYMAHHQGMTILAIANVAFDGLMRDRFHDEPMVRATELLLEERAPQHVPVSTAQRGADSEPRTTKAMVTPAERVYGAEEAMAPNLQLMSNGRLSLTLTSAGASRLRWDGLAINRWSHDQSAHDGTDHIYLRDADSGRIWSPAALPFHRAPDEYQVRFTDDRARYSSRQDASLTSVLTHQISPEADAVLRRLTLSNDGPDTRRVDVASYVELVLGRSNDDRAHPVFSKLFVHTELLDEGNVLIATRRRRSPSDPEVWAAHFVQAEQGADFLPAAPLAETDRRNFLGRGGNVRQPAQLVHGRTASGTIGYTLDPILSLTQPVELPAGQRVVLDWWTVVAGSREELLRLVHHHRAPGSGDRLAMLAWTQAQVQLRHLGMDAEQSGDFQDLAARIAYPQLDMRASAERLLAAGPQSDLWSMSISGDLPLLVVRIQDAADLGLVTEVVRAFELWRLRRFPVDVVLLNEEATGYAQELQHRLEEAANSISLRTGNPDSTGRIYVVRRDQVTPAALAALHGAAAVELLARRGSIAQQLRPAVGIETGGGRLHAMPRPQPSVPAEPTPSARADLRYFNGFGGFNAEGDEYVIYNDPQRPTPAPWTNVVANEQFGFLATAEGGGATWWRNSRDNQLTAWRNDPVANPLSEALYIRDDDTDAIYSPASAVSGQGRHTTRHGHGYTVHAFDSAELSCSQTSFVPLDDPVKISLVTLTNTSARPMQLTVTSYAAIVLGQHRDLTARHLITEYDAPTGALLARNPYSVDYRDQVVFADMGGAQEAWTGDRARFLGPSAGLRQPHAVTRREPLDMRVGAGLDPCLAQQRSIRLDAGQSVEFPLFLGAGRDLAEVRDLLARYRAADLNGVLDQVREHWRGLLGQVQVNTPDDSFDLMLNGWLLYQTMACRMLARVGYYQASGAFGFRDQLQDSMAAVLVAPELAREHLLRAAGRQFVEGDVQHWWLPATGAGVRTRITDDVVWLAQAAVRYIDITGDSGVLDEQISFLHGDLLADDEHERFFTPAVTEQTASLYEHCVLGLQRAFRHGRFGLPLMGTGDWNDGMNRVGADGEGESVWLGWFLHTTLTAFMPLARQRGDHDFVAAALAEQSRLLAALEEAGWDGQWYRRAYFDDATPLGSSGRTECAIDGIVQSWAVLSEAARPERAASAMEAMYDQLVDHENRLIKLFTGPFDVSEPDPGYIRSYPPGVRENGGQYTHGAVWSILAWAAMGRDDRAGEAFALVNPVNHALDAEAAERYRVEPYVLAADVYSVEPYAGRGGWTWYTGSSGWLYRAGLEAILGLRRHGERLEIRCCLPPEWPSASVLFSHGQARYDIEISGEPGVGRQVIGCTLDGQPVPVVAGSAMLNLDRAPGTHWVTVLLGQASVAKTE